MYRKILLLTILFVLISAKNANAEFADMENSIDNDFSASTLYFNLYDTADNPVDSPLLSIFGMQPGGSQTKSIRITKGGIEDFRYTINFEKISGDDNLCNGLQIEAKISNITQYNGSLSSFSLPSSSIISSSGMDQWELTVRLDDTSSGLQNKTCNFNFVFHAFQTNSDGSWGFSDSHSLNNYFSSGTWTAPVDQIDNQTPEEQTQTDDLSTQDSTQSSDISPVSTDAQISQPEDVITPTPALDTITTTPTPEQQTIENVQDNQAGQSNTAGNSTSDNSATGTSPPETNQQ